ncbi:trehalose-phosphatase [Psychrobacter sp. GP33]|uniref:trehalose-phosphatase n=1 Tax=Psychrobacter sp. GP33 TaxID=2758709 RepID=UPI0015F955B3|nr:trehalose-phosphatase [Psychrobacter sp. GP33]
MTSGRSPSINSPPIYIQPKNFADYLSHQQDYYLFLDIDGTLADFTLNPKDSFIPNKTLTLLQKIQNHGIKVAIVTGRSLTEARQMLCPVHLPIAATHGLEIAFDGSSVNDTDVTSVDTVELAAIRQVISQFCMPYDDLTIENKPYSVALHYRQNPTLADVAYTIMTKALKQQSDWTLKAGKYVLEAVPKGANKGSAILTLLQKTQTSAPIYPIFIGDDMTDEAGFMAVQDRHIPTEKSRLLENYISPISIDPIQGMGIKVGSEPTCAHYYVHNIQEVTILLHSFLSFCQKSSALSD